MVGLPLSFNAELEHISAFMKENSETELTIKMTNSKAMFFSIFSKEIGIEKNLPDSIEWHREKDVGIYLKGRTRILQKGMYLAFETLLFIIL